MSFEDGHGKREMLVDYPLHEFLVGEMRLAVVGDGVFQALAFSFLSHGDCVVGYEAIEIQEMSIFYAMWNR